MKEGRMIRSEAWIGCQLRNQLCSRNHFGRDYQLFFRAVFGNLLARLVQGETRIIV